MPASSPPQTAVSAGAVQRQCRPCQPASRRCTQASDSVIAPPCRSPCRVRSARRPSIGFGSHFAEPALDPKSGHTTGSLLVGFGPSTRPAGRKEPMNLAHESARGRRSLLPLGRPRRTGSRPDCRQIDERTQAGTRSDFRVPASPSAWIGRTYVQPSNTAPDSLRPPVNGQGATFTGTGAEGPRTRSRGYAVLPTPSRRRTSSLCRGRFTWTSSIRCCLGDRHHLPPGDRHCPQAPSRRRCPSPA
jgi:hypothetical protein